jgi:phosphomethylpyrimidine synthase
LEKSLRFLKITQDVREYAKEQNLEGEKALAVGMAEKAKEFVATGGEIYHGKPEGVDDHH